MLDSSRSSQRHRRMSRKYQASARGRSPPGYSKHLQQRSLCGNARMDYSARAKSSSPSPAQSLPRSHHEDPYDGERKARSTPGWSHLKDGNATSRDHSSDHRHQLGQKIPSASYRRQSPLPHRKSPPELRRVQFAKTSHHSHTPHSLTKREHRSNPSFAQMLHLQ